MADLRMIVQWSVVLTPQEFRLVQRALRGVIVDEEERAQAKELQEKLMRTRAKEAEQLHAEAQKVIANMEEG